MEKGQNSKSDCDLVFGIIGPIGCNRKMIIEIFTALAPHFKYHTEVISVSKIISSFIDNPTDTGDEFERVSEYMNAGNLLREKSEDNSFLAKLTAVEISKTRPHSKRRTIYIIDSLKHPAEVMELRDVYKDGFYLFGVHSSEKNREQYLENFCNISSADKRRILMDRDKEDRGPDGKVISHGQATSEAFHLADFFLTENGNSTSLFNALERFMDIIFGHPFKTSSFHEFAMFMAHASSARSSDMSRQVGAVIAKETDIIGTGANECPKGGGGTYWPLFNPEENKIYDWPKGRDYTRDLDFNGKEKARIIDKLKEGLPTDAVEKLKENILKSGISDITEFGRVVHAEMDALLGCARRGIACGGATLYSTTYPCHNCAKHIVASGITKVLYIEPYPKSKALEMHDDSICNPDNEKDEKQARSEEKVVFVPFVGVGPRRFIDLFSLGLSSGATIRRKKSGSYEKAEWKRIDALPRLKMYDVTHLTAEAQLKMETDEKISDIKKFSSSDLARGNITMPTTTLE